MYEYLKIEIETSGSRAENPSIILTELGKKGWKVHTAELELNRDVYLLERLA